MSDAPPQPKGPLADLVVIELGTLIAGPFCGQILADFGAEVIKVEDPGTGDPMRQWGRSLPQGAVALVAGDRAEQEVGHRQPARARGPGDRPRPRAEGRRAGRELPARHDGEVGPLLREPRRRQPAPRHGPRLRLRPDRALRGPGRLRPDRRGDGRPSRHHRRARPAARPRRRLDRRQPGGHPRGDGRPDGAACARTHRPRPGDRRGDLRERAGDDGEPRHRVRPHRLHPRALRLGAARHRALQRLSDRRRHDPDRRQRRHGVRAALRRRWASLA